ncbi:MAG: YdeI/OmpD-associated family protein [Candidatus Aminicenantes bacterium]|nr:YdeI/OmpD-associated family protein [Candidatus Aminicenantes bacterium]
MNALHVVKREVWRQWLKKNGTREKEVWLEFYKRHTGKARLEYGDAVEEALCFGWIDSTIRRLDEERYAQKFTPRKRGSRWSDLNIARAKKMITAGLMTPAGSEQIDADLLRRGPRPSPAKAAGCRPVPEYITAALGDDEKARAFFESLAPSYRRLYVGWVDSAKKEETRQRRLAEMLASLRANRKLGMK